MSLAGVNHQFKQVSGSKKGLKGRLNPINLMFFLVASTILGSSSFVIFSYVVSSVSSRVSSSAASPTSIPWIENKSDCQSSQRTWREDKCWDYEHNPTF